MAASTGVLQASYVYTLDGKRYSNQVHFKQAASDPAEASLGTFAAGHGAAIKALWVNELVPLISSSVALVEIQMKWFDQTRRLPDIPPAPIGTPQAIQFRVAEETVYTAGMPIAGGVADTFIPAFNSLRARKISGTPGRRGRGHNSFAGIPEAGSDGNVLVTGDWTTWQTNAPLLLGSSYTFADDLFDYVMLPVVLSLTAAQAAALEFVPAADYAYQITSVIPNRLIGTMRRRKKKVV